MKLHIVTEYMCLSLSLSLTLTVKHFTVLQVLQVTP